MLTLLFMYHFGELQGEKNLHGAATHFLKRSKVPGLRFCASGAHVCVFALQLLSLSVLEMTSRQ